jgi:O-antigen/teichoic acid export membrane protein
MYKEVRRVLRDSTIYGLGSLIIRASAIVLAPIYTTYLTRADYGVMSYIAMLSSMLGTVMMLGQSGSLVLFYRSTAEHINDRRVILFNVFWFVMLFSGILVALGFIFGPALAARITGSKDIPFNPYLVLALLTAFIGLPQAMQQSINRALGQAKMFIAFQLSTFVLNTGFTLYFVVALRQGAYGSLKGTLVAAAIMAPLSLVVVVRRWTPRFSWEKLSHSLTFGLPLLPHYFAGWVLTYIDRYLLVKLSTLSQVGLYSLAYNFSMVLNLFCRSINQAWGPIYYDLADTEEGRKMLPRLTTVYAATVTVLGIGFTLFAPDLMVLLVNRRFNAAAPVVPVVTAGYYMFALYMVVSTPIFHARKTTWVPAISGTAALLNLGGNLILIPRFGMLGAAWATFGAYAFMAALARVISNRLRPGIYEDRNLALLIGIYSLSLAAAIVLVNLQLPIWLDLIAKVAIAPPILALIFVCRIATVDEVRAFVKRREKRGRRRPSAGEQATEAERTAGEIGTTSDDTGVLPDDMRP